MYGFVTGTTTFSTLHPALILMRTFLVLQPGAASTVAWTDRKSPVPRASMVTNGWSKGLTHLWWRFSIFLNHFIPESPSELLPLSVQLLWTTPYSSLFQSLPFNLCFSPNFSPSCHYQFFFSIPNLRKISHWWRTPPHQASSFF